MELGLAEFFLAIKKSLAQCAKCVSCGLPVKSHGSLCESQILPQGWT